MECALSNEEQRMGSHAFYGIELKIENVNQTEAIVKKHTSE